MDFITTYQNKIILLDGPMETRLKYDYKVSLASDFAIYQFIYDAKVSHYLTQLYQNDIAIAKKYSLPILLNIPTYRASQKFLPMHGFHENDVAKINQDCFSFVAKIKQASDYEDIYIMAPIGPKNDAYDARLALSAQESLAYHQPQIQALAHANVDLLSIITMPSLKEALGCAFAASEVSTPYIIGFVVTSEGKLLDGTDLHTAIREIDRQASPKPLCYIFSCTHADIAKAILKNDYPEYDRIKGIKANGSCKPLDQLEQANCALADPADVFADEIYSLTKQFHWKLVGGCCGTDDSHLEAIANLLHKQTL